MLALATLTFVTSATVGCGALSVGGEEESVVPAIGEGPGSPVFTASDGPVEDAVTAGHLGPGILARLDGEAITDAEYTRFLRAWEGMRLFSDFIDQRLVERRAAALGITVADDELDRLVDADIAKEIEQVRGDTARHERSVARLNHTSGSYRRWKRFRLRPQLLLDRCIEATREISNDEVRARFEEMFGAEGIIHQVRHIMIYKNKHSSPEAALDRCQEVMRKLEEEPERFAEWVKEYSDHAPTRRNDGVITSYRPGSPRRRSLFGEEFDRAVTAIENVGELRGPIETEWGYHVIQLLDRNQTSLEDVAESIRSELEKQPPTPRERRRFRQLLRRDAKIER